MSDQQNNEVFVIECPVDTVAFMTALEWHRRGLAGMSNIQICPIVPMKYIRGSMKKHFVKL